MKSIIVKIALLGVTLIAMSACCNKGGNTADAVLDNIHSRKSVRQYTSEPVSEEQYGPESILMRNSTPGSTTSSVFLLPSSRSARSQSDILQATSSLKTNGNRKTSITASGKTEYARRNAWRILFYRR